MNVIVANKHQLMLENLGIDIIKEMTGEFEVDEIIATFQNFFYQRMLLDITAIKDYKNISNLQKLSISLDMDKVILILDGTLECSNPTFLSQLVSMGIYNFTQNVEGIQYLYNSPNSYRDVAQYQQLGPVATQVETPTVNTTNQGPIIQTVYVDRYNEPKGCRIIGIKNATKQSGATTLTYLMKKALEKNYETVAIEVDKSDFNYFKDKSLITSNSTNIGAEIAKNNNKDVILVDINNSTIAESMCHDVLYLVEPSIIKLNKMMSLNSGILQVLKNKKVVLNQSLLSQKDLADFEYESKIKIFYNMPPINDREKNNQYIKNLLAKLGFAKIGG